MSSEPSGIPPEENWAEELWPLLEKLSASKVDLDAGAIQRHTLALYTNTKLLQGLIAQFRRITQPSPLPQLSARQLRRLRRVILVDCRARCRVRRR
jgi:hypothetical protein